MSTATPSARSSADATAGPGRKDEFDGCLPQRVDAVAIMPQSAVSSRWDKLYSKAGVGSGGEEIKRSLRCAVYCYLAINGTSPSGEYTGEIVSGKGSSLLAAEIPNVVGRLDVRRFMRGCAEESVKYFHSTNVLETLSAMVVRCEALSIRPSDAVALCDWLDGAVGLTPSERDTQAVLKDYALKRARAARGHHSVEEIRQGRLNSSVQAEGQVSQSLDHGNNYFG